MGSVIFFKLTLVFTKKQKLFFFFFFFFFVKGRSKECCLARGQKKMVYLSLFKCSPSENGLFGALRLDGAFFSLQANTLNSGL